MLGGEIGYLGYTESALRTMAPLIDMSANGARPIRE